jgi:hypothetical protein
MTSGWSSAGGRREDRGDDRRDRAMTGATGVRAPGCSGASSKLARTPKPTAASPPSRTMRRYGRVMS